MYRSLEEILGTYDPVKPAVPGRWSDAGGSNRAEEEAPAPGEQPAVEEVPPIDHAPVPPLTTPDDTSGG